MVMHCCTRRGGCRSITVILRVHCVTSLKMRVRYGISIVFLLTSSCNALSEYEPRNTCRDFGDLNRFTMVYQNSIKPSIVYKVIKVLSMSPIFFNPVIMIILQHNSFLELFSSSFTYLYKSF